MVYKVGQKFEGFKFSEEDANFYYNSLMDEWVGKIGTIRVIRDNGTVGVLFQDKHGYGQHWSYPISENITKIRELDYEPLKL